MIDKLSTLGLDISVNTGAAGSYMAGSAIDLSVARDVGAGIPLYLVITSKTAFVGDGTLQFVLVTDAQDPAVTGAEQMVLSPVFEDVDFAAGKLMFAVSLPSGFPAYEQFIQLMEIVGTSAWTSGDYHAYLTDVVPAWVSYADGQN